MKTTVFSTLIVIALMGSAPAQSLQSSSAAGPAPHLTSKQASRLINTARTEDEHRQLAQYFRWEAQKNRDCEQFYRETSASYRLHPLRADMYRNESTANRYERLAVEVRSLALADDQLAKYQDRLADALTPPE